MMVAGDDDGVAGDAGRRSGGQGAGRRALLLDLLCKVLYNNIFLYHIILYVTNPATQGIIYFYILIITNSATLGTLVTWAGLAQTDGW